MRAKNSNQKYKVTFTQIDSDILQKIEKMPNARYVDLGGYKDFFDDAPFYRDTLMYYDGAHINYYGSVKYALYSGDEFMKYLKWALD